MNIICIPCEKFCCRHRTEDQWSTEDGIMAIVTKATIFSQTGWTCAKLPVREMNNTRIKYASCCMQQTRRLEQRSEWLVCRVGREEIPLSVYRDAVFQPHASPYFAN